MAASLQLLRISYANVGTPLRMYQWFIKRIMSISQKFISLRTGLFKQDFNFEHFFLCNLLVFQRFHGCHCFYFRAFFCLLLQGFLYLPSPNQNFILFPWPLSLCIFVLLKRQQLFPCPYTFIAINEDNLLVLGSVVCGCMLYILLMAFAFYLLLYLSEKNNSIKIKQRIQFFFSFFF